MAGQRVASGFGGALTAHATVVFVDESGFSQRPNVRRTWSPRGQTPVIADHLSWDCVSAIGALVWRPADPDDVRLFLSLRDHAIRQQDVVSYLQSLRRHIRGPVVVVWDNLSAHRAQTVRAYAAANEQWLTVEHLPPYAPELNPVEQVWANLRGRELANYTPDSLGELTAQIACGKRRIRRVKHGLNFIKHCGLLDLTTINLKRKGH